MTDALENHQGTVSIGGRTITNLRFADDIDGLAGDELELAHLVERLEKTSISYGMEISAENTKLMRCFRKILRISHKDHVTNEAVRNKIKQAIGPYDDLLTTVKKRKLKWYGHVSRSSGLAKTLLQGTVREGWGRRGRQKQKWEDNIKEWTGMEFADSQRAVENRETWRELVRKSSMVPQRSLRVIGK